MKSEELERVLKEDEKTELERQYEAILDHFLKSNSGDGTYSVYTLDEGMEISSGTGLYAIYNSNKKILEFGSSYNICESIKKDYEKVSDCTLTRYEFYDEEKQIKIGFDKIIGRCREVIDFFRIPNYRAAIEFFMYASCLEILLRGKVNKQLYVFSPIDKKILKEKLRRYPRIDENEYEKYDLYIPIKMKKDIIKTTQLKLLQKDLINFINHYKKKYPYLTTDRLLYADRPNDVKKFKDVYDRQGGKVCAYLGSINSQTQSFLASNIARGILIEEDIIGHKNKLKEEDKEKIKDFKTGDIFEQAGNRDVTYDDSEKIFKSKDVNMKSNIIYLLTGIPKDEEDDI